MGCGSGYNLVSLAKMNWEPYGCEISSSIAKHALKTVSEYGIHPEIKVGDNCNIPYPDNYFDMLLSLNTIHYLNTSEAYRKALIEFRRVLAPGGRLILFTLRPGNWILDNAIQISPFTWEISCKSDYRKGDILFVFSSTDDLKQFYSPYFNKIRIAENRIDFFTRVLCHYVVTGLKSSK